MLGGMEFGLVHEPLHHLGLGLGRDAQVVERGEWEMFEESVTEVDLTEEQAATTAQIAHFSDVVDIDGPLTAGEGEGDTIAMALESHGDGSCILDHDEMRVKIQMERGPLDERVYDLALEGLTEYAPISAYLG